MLGVVLEKKSSLTKKCDPCPKNVHCVPPIQCPAYVRLETFDKPQLCDLPAGTHGYCCTSGYNHTSIQGILPIESNFEANFVYFSQNTNIITTTITIIIITMIIKIIYNRGSIRTLMIITIIIN